MSTGLSTWQRDGVEPHHWAAVSMMKPSRMRMKKSPSCSLRNSSPMQVVTPRRIRAEVRSQLKESSDEHRHVRP